MPRTIPYPRIAARLFNTPLLLRPETAELVSSVLAERLGIQATVEIEAAIREPAKASLFNDGDEPDERRDLPYQMVGGTALISITGELVNRGSWIDAMSGLTSYKAVGAALAQAAGDAVVTGVLLDIDSGGGEASGAMELGALVRRISSLKPVTAFVDGQACSAAYAIASGATEIICTPSATLGSIGVVLLHIDRSGAMQKAGLKPTLIQKGKYKTDGASVKPLAGDAIARLDGYLDVLYGLFVSSVATHRASLSEEDVRNTEAGLFIGHEAVDAGLADKVGTLEDALATLPRPPETTSHFPVSMRNDMTTPAAAESPIVPPVASPPALSGSNVPDPPATGAPSPSPAIVAVAQPVASGNGAKSERERIAAILGHKEAEGRQEQARHLAFNTDMSPDAAIAILAAGAKVSDPAPFATGGRLIQEMAAMKHPSLGSSAADLAVSEAEAGRSAGKTKDQLEYEEGRRTAARLLGKTIA